MSTPELAPLTKGITPDGFGFARLKTPDGPRIAVVTGEAVFGAEHALGSPLASLNGILPNWAESVDAVTQWLAGPMPSKVTPIAAAYGDVLCPVTPEHIYQAAANYRRHVVDLMVASPRPEDRGLDEAARRRIAETVMDERAASGVPTVFSGVVSSLSGAYDDVIIPRITRQCDWELELAAVIGRPTRYVAREEALDSVAGYTIVNDLTMRDRLYPSGDSGRGPDWLACKGAPTFLPVGPVVVPAVFVPDPHNLRIRLSLNGATMQDESTADMIYGLPRLVEHASYCALLRPGDLLLTGSPAGNGVHHGRFLRDGDMMTGSVTGLGVQRNRTTDERGSGAQDAGRAVGVDGGRR